MTPGQERALRELEWLQETDEDNFELIDHYLSDSGNLIACVSIRMGLMEKKDDGLQLMDREEFIVGIPPDFPFDCPWINVPHDRFAGFPHVIWKKTLCLYQSKEIEWNPSDGLYGFFDRLKLWLGKASINDMDPIDGPLEPPHHLIDSSQIPFVIRKNAPIEAKQFWIGVAELKKYDNRMELVEWYNSTKECPQNARLSLAIILKESLPMEFPRKGKDFFQELLNQGLDKKQIIKDLALASLFTPDGEPIYLILGSPMRRSADGTPKIHIDVWTTHPDLSESLHLVLPQKNDTEEILNIRQEISDKICSFFEETNIRWCKVMDDRSEIIVRRDKDSPLTWLTNKKILLLGCGALGSWTGEIIARAKPKLIHLVDKSKVNIGILSRQNYELEDFCSNKSEALTKRLQKIIRADKTKIEPFCCEAHKFLTEDLERIGNYDLIIDCTASSIFQMKIERDWNKFEVKTPAIISMVIDAKAERCLSVIVNKKSSGGVWDAYVQLKNKISMQGTRRDIVESFYSNKAVKGLFQPEPGCSDPTFSGSTADMFALVSMALNNAMSNIVENNIPSGLAFSVHTPNKIQGKIDFFVLQEMKGIKVGNYRVRISPKIEPEARAWVKQNKRIRSPHHETGGLLWGLWDDAVNVIWVFDISGPPPDSKHERGYFLCGIDGTQSEYERRIKQSNGTNEFVGLWHTHPDMSSGQSIVDVASMATLVSNLGHKQKRVLMLIFGEQLGKPVANIYVYESNPLDKKQDLVSVGEGQMRLEKRVV
ncbi:MAG: ThiF family adenylyltransferase [Desulfobacteraceae bacterium]